LCAFTSMMLMETSVISWLLVIIIAASVAVLIAHAIDAIRS
jgi:hypothetical protein